MGVPFLAYFLIIFAVYLSIIKTAKLQFFKIHLLLLPISIMQNLI